MYLSVKSLFVIIMLYEWNIMIIIFIFLKNWFKNNTSYQKPIDGLVSVIVKGTIWDPWKQTSTHH